MDRDSLVAAAERLGAVVDGMPENVDAALPRLSALLEASQDPLVVTAVVQALGRSADPRSAAMVLDLVGHDRPEWEVRLAVAQALPFGALNGASSLRDRVLAVLVELTNDPRDEVRDWACFGLGVLQADTPAVREALVARIHDRDTDTRCEALLALARTGDPRALTEVRRRLEGAHSLFTLELEAASELADPSLVPGLRAWQREWADDDSEDQNVRELARALDRCSPATVDRAAEIETALLAGVRAAVAAGTAVELCGSYPQTRLSLAGPAVIDGAVVERLWQHESPTDYDLALQVRSISLTYAPSPGRAGP